MELKVEHGVSMADVAARAGVSTSTVSRALRSSTLVAADTTARVRAAAEDLGYAVSRAASSLVTGRYDRVAVLLGGRLGAWFNGATLDGAFPVLQQAGLDLLIYRVESRDERSAFFDRLPARRNADALIVVSFGLGAAEHARLEQLQMPVVYLNQTYADAAGVAIDDRAGVAAGVRYLLRLGHRRFAFCGVEQTRELSWSAVTRVEGFRSALRAGGLDPDGHPQLLEPYGGRPADLVARLLSRSEPPTAVVAESDEIAFGLLAAYARAGVDVPGTVSVLGFDDHDLAADYGLSTVAQPVRRLGQLAAQLTVELLQGREPEPRHHLVPTSLVIRDTTGPAPSLNG